MADAYQWVPFYEAHANKILSYKDKQRELFELTKNLASQQSMMNYFHFEKEEWWESRKYQMDPFSVMGVLNRNMKDENRIKLAEILADSFKITLPVPTQFDGIPVLNNMKSFFTGVDKLWDLFVSAIESDKKTHSPMNLRGRLKRLSLLKAMV